jgi:hypothetical protein
VTTGPGTQGRGPTLVRFLGEVAARERALADPARREIVALVAEQRLSIREMAERLPRIPRLRDIIERGLLTERTVALSPHAVDRYLSRFEPDCDRDEARRRLYMRMHRARYSPVRPGWLRPPDVPSPHENVGYLLIDDRIALPLRDNDAAASSRGSGEAPLMVVTCLCRPP